MNWYRLIIRKTTSIKTKWNIPLTVRPPYFISIVTDIKCADSFVFMNFTNKMIMQRNNVPLNDSVFIDLKKNIYLKAILWWLNKNEK
jgi:hypothetical protein